MTTQANDPSAPRSDFLSTPADEIPHLRAGALSTVDLVAAGMAQIAPAIASFFVLGAIVAVAGVGTPLVVLIAGLGFAFHVNSTAEFNRTIPSAGSYVTYLGRAFGDRVGAAGAAVFTLAQLTIGMALFYQVGVWTASSVQAAFGVTLAWWIPTLVVEAAVAALVVIGIRLSIRVAITMFLFEIAILALGALAMLIHQHAAISAAGFLPSHITSGLGGLGLGFPLAIFLFLGASTPAPLAEETTRPRRAVPMAVFTACALAIVIYVGVAWAQGIGFRNNVAALTKVPFPFITAAGNAFGPMTDLMYLAGFTSAVAVLLAFANSTSRVWYSMARDGLLPSWLNATHPTFKTPARVVISAAALMMVATLVLGVLAGADNGFGWSASFGTIGLVLIFIAVNFALTAFYFRQRRAQFSVARHVAAPLIGTVAFAWPLWQTVNPGQASPFNWFGAAWIGLLVLAVVYGHLMARRGVKVGSHLAAADGAAV